MIRPPPKSTQSTSSAASDVYKRQIHKRPVETLREENWFFQLSKFEDRLLDWYAGDDLSLIHISEPTRPY